MSDMRRCEPRPRRDRARCVVDLLNGLGLHKAHFVGNSWGGMIGATFAARYPDRLDRAVLMNCTASKAGFAQKAKYAAMLRVAAVLGGIRPPLTRSALRAFLGPTTLRTRPDVVETVRANLRAVNIDSARWAVRSVVPARPDRTPCGAGRPRPGERGTGRLPVRRRQMIRENPCGKGLLPKRIAEPSRSRVRAPGAVD